MSDSDVQELRQRRSKLTNSVPDELMDEVISVIDDSQLYAGLEEQCSLFSPILDRFDVLIKEEMTYPEESHHRRKLYSDLELSRLDFTENPLVERVYRVHGHIKSAKRKDTLANFESSRHYTLVAATLERYDTLRNAMAIPPQPAGLMKRLFCTLILAVFVLSTSTVLILLSPIRMIHPFLRKRGVPTHRLPVDLMQQLFARGSMYWAGVDVCWEGLERVDESQSYLTLYSHQSSLDAFILCTCPLPFRLIGKTSLYYIPFLGWLSFVWGNYSIDRRNLTRAKATLAAALTELKTHHRSLLISPEGTRSKVGRPIDFKKGPFHTAMQARFPVMPVLVLGASELWHAKQWGCVPGRVTMRVLPPVEVCEGDTHSSLQSRVHRQFLAAYGEPHGPTRTVFHWMDVAILPLSLLSLYTLRLLLWG